MEHKTITQTVFFIGGPYSNRLADIEIRLPFSRDNTLLIEGELYEIVPGPISELLEKKQEQLNNHCLQILHVGTHSEPN